MSDVSVVMGTYNGARHIRDQLSTILGQSEIPGEIIVCDDGSVDETVEIAQEIAASAPMPVHVHRNADRLGFANNFLKAAGLATKRFIAFSDQDDLWHPDKLAKSRAAIIAFDAVMATHQVNLVTESGHRLRVDDQSITGTAVVEPLTSDPFGVYLGFTVMIDRRVLESIPAERRGMDNYSPTEVLSHDRWAFFLASCFGRIVTLAEPLAEYRQHGSQAFGIKPVGLTQRVRNKVAEGPTKLAFLAELAQRRAELLEDCGREPGAGSRGVVAGGAAWDAATWSAALAHWRRIEVLCRNRHDIYVDKRFRRRVALLVSNAWQGAYRAHGSGGLGRKRLLEDSSLGLFGQFVSWW